MSSKQNFPNAQPRPVSESDVTNLPSDLAAKASTTYVDAAVAGVDTVAVHQVAHGFASGKAVYFTGSAWALAQSNDGSKLGIGVIIVQGVDDFTVYLSGLIAGLSGLTAGQYYFVDDATAGLLSTTEPTSTSSYSNPLLFALTTTTALIVPFRPSQIEQTAIVIVNKIGNYTANAGETVRCDTSSGSFTVTLPLSASSTGLRVRVKKVTADVNTVTVARSGSDLMDGQTLWVITGQWDIMEFEADGAGNWDIV